MLGELHMRHGIEFKPEHLEQRDLASLQDALCWRVLESGGRRFALTPGYGL